MESFFGESLSGPQLATTAACFGTWLAVQHGATGPVLSLLLGEDLWKSRSEEQRHKCGISFTAGCFAATSLLFGSVGLLWPSPAIVADPIYGRSSFVQFAAANGVAFFMWNIWAENSRVFVGLPNFIHHVCCLICFVFMQYPFSPRVASVLMLFEASTPPLCAFNILKLFDLEHTPLYGKFRLAFAVLFFIFRLALGIPQTVLWYADMYALYNDQTRQIHSMKVFSMSLLLPVPYFGVQFYWFWLIARAAVRKRGKNAGNTVPTVPTSVPAKGLAKQRPAAMVRVENS